MGTAEEVFELLLKQYYLDVPTGISPSQLHEWKAKYLLPMQGRVLSIFTTWLEEHSMIEDDPPVARRLQSFLAEITSPQENVLHAQKVMKTLERLVRGFLVFRLQPRPLTYHQTFAVPAIQQQPAVRAPKRRRTRDNKNELLRTDAVTLAENLCLLEHALYVKIRPYECLEWVKIRTGESVANLATFIALHDKVASWVKQSILWEEDVRSRADLVEFWIKVAEVSCCLCFTDEHLSEAIVQKSRAMRNFTSTSAIVTALSSAVIQRLHLTWAYAKKTSHLDQLTQLNDPAGSFAAYRQAQQATDTPCVPFIGMYLTDILHINDHYQDSSVKTGMSADHTERLFSFVKRRKWSDTLDTILAHQKQRYTFPQDLMIIQLIEASLIRANEVVPNAFWAQSHDIQAAERQSLDIRGGLEDAGF
jgi:son of sevenless